MLAIPFAFTGVILALLITNTTLSIVAALGAVMLVGIVTKNGIVLIDFINLMREREFACMTPSLRLVALVFVRC